MSCCSSRWLLVLFGRLALRTTHGEDAEATNEYEFRNKRIQFHTGTLAAANSDCKQRLQRQRAARHHRLDEVAPAKPQRSTRVLGLRNARKHRRSAKTNPKMAEQTQTNPTRKTGLPSSQPTASQASATTRLPKKFGFVLSKSTFYRAPLSESGNPSPLFFVESRSTISHRPSAISHRPLPSIHAGPGALCQRTATTAAILSHPDNNVNTQSP